MSMSPTQRTRPLRADAERNRQRLIAAAQELFASRGIDVTLDDVARHAGVGVGTVYRRFANREELIEAVLMGAVRRLAEHAEVALTNPDPWQGFEEFFVASARDFAENRGLRELVLERDRGTADAFVDARNGFQPATTALISRAQEAGELRDDLSPVDFPLIQLMLGAVTHHTRDVAPELWRRYVTLVLDGLRTRRDAPSAFGAPAITEEQFDRALN
ncbi:TetR/AcrR family transcriptional regulator [Nocardioides sp. NPDC057577]|uniref:TetR/AcrR family transcriptional regulator n=1 Tax=Nocardioides sp. NPDC057577 TaxID=3346171 RepID=UPI00367332DB